MNRELQDGNGQRRVLDVIDTAKIENAAELTLTAFCWWRPDIAQSVCEAYWRDVHGIMFARVPGMWQCRQLRLAAASPGRRRAVNGVSFEVAAAAQPQGIGHALFLSKADLDAFGNNPLARETIPNDARNFIGRIGALLSMPGGRTLVDRINDPIAQGPPALPSFVLCFVPGAGVASVKAFHHYLAKHIAHPWSEHPGVMRLRVEPLPPYEQSAMASPAVPHQWPDSETYLGWIELAVRDEAIVSELLARAAAGNLAEKVAAIHSYAVREIYTMISAGRPTEVGLRGYPAMQTINSVGAANQRSEPVLKMLYGDAVRGLDQLRRA